MRGYVRVDLRALESYNYLCQIMPCSAIDLVRVGLGLWGEASQKGASKGEFQQAHLAFFAWVFLADCAPLTHVFPASEIYVVNSDQLRTG